MSVRIWYEQVKGAENTPIVLVHPDGTRDLASHVYIYGPSEVKYNPNPGPGERRVYVETDAEITWQT